MAIDVHIKQVLERHLEGKPIFYSLPLGQDRFSSPVIATVFSGTVCTLRNMEADHLTRTKTGWIQVSYCRSQSSPSAVVLKLCDILRETVAALTTFVFLPNVLPFSRSQLVTGPPPLNLPLKQHHCQVCWWTLCWGFGRVHLQRPNCHNVKLTSVLFYSDQMVLNNVCTFNCQSQQLCHECANSQSWLFSQISNTLQTIGHLQICLKKVM